MSLGYMVPLLLVIFCNLCYHLLSKSIPSDINPFLGLSVTYGVAFVGLVIIGVEGGYMLMYRAGWEVSKASVCANIVLAVLLLIIGAVFFKELLDVKKIIGVLLCILGIVLLK
ncbi:MAG: transporter [Clostridium sp.]|nr:transporter [Clostridium sp.]